MTRVQQPASTLERIALEQRLSKLGLTVGEDGVIDTAQAKVTEAGGKTGAAALEAVGKDGVIGLDQAVLLQRQRGFLALLRGREAPVSEKHSSALKSLAMSADGLASEMNGLVKQLPKSGLDDKKLDAITRRAEQVGKGLEVLITGEANLAACSPESVRALATALGGLTEASSNYLGALSEAREKAFASAADMTPQARQTLIKSLLASASQLERVSSISRAVSTSNVGVVDPAALGKMEQEALKTAERAKLDAMSPQDALAQLEQLTQGIAQQNAATIEKQKLEAMARAQDLAELKEKLGAFNTSGPVAVLANFVKQKFNPPDGNNAPGTQQALTLGAFDLGKEAPIQGLSRDHSYELNMLVAAMTPNKAYGDQKLLLTANGLRVYGPSKWNKDDYTTRVPDPKELAAAGWTMAKLEAQLNELAKVAATTPDKLQATAVRVNRDDALMTNGLTPSADVPALMKELESALSVAAHLRGPEVVKVLDSQVGKMSAGEFRDFAIKVMNRVAGTSRGGEHRFHTPRDMTLWIHPQHMALIRDHVVADLKQYPFDAEKRDFMGDNGLHRAMVNLFYATESGSTCYKVFDPNGHEVSIANHQYGAWCDVCKRLKPYKYDDSWY